MHKSHKQRGRFVWCRLLCTFWKSWLFIHRLPLHAFFYVHFMMMHVICYNKKNINEKTNLFLINGRAGCVDWNWLESGRIFIFFVNNKLSIYFPLKNITDLDHSEHSKKVLTEKFQKRSKSSPYHLWCPKNKKERRRTVNK